MLAFRSHVGHILFHEEFIFLDEIKNSYLFLDREDSESLSYALETGNENEISRDLQRAGILTSSKRRQYISTFSMDLFGIDNYQWHLTNRFRISQPSKISVVTAFITLAIVKLSLASIGLHRTLNFIRKSKNKMNPSGRMDGSERERVAMNYATAIGHAATYLPGRVECLESAITLAILLSQSSIDNDFKIGVQKYDFLAHAWVEVDGIVIGDEQQLTQRLAPILSI